MKRALIFRGGWTGHEPVQTSDLVAGELRMRGMEVEIFEQQECLLQPDLETKYDLVIPVWTMGTLIPEGSAALRERIVATLTELMVSSRAQTVLAVSHGSATLQFKRAWEHAARCPQDVHLGNCCVLVYEFDPAARTFVCEQIVNQQRDN